MITWIVVIVVDLWLLDANIARRDRKAARRSRREEQKRKAWEDFLSAVRKA
jgi:hypothetical protein